MFYASHARGLRSEEARFELVLGCIPPILHYTPLPSADGLVAQLVRVSD